MKERSKKTNKENEHNKFIDENYLPIEHFINIYTITAERWQVWSASSFSAAAKFCTVGQYPRAEFNRSAEGNEPPFDSTYKT